MRTTAAVALGIVGGLTLLAVGCSAMIEAELTRVNCSWEGAIGPPACEPGQICRAGVCSGCAPKEVCGDSVDNDCNGAAEDGCDDGGLGGGAGTGGSPTGGGGGTGGSLQGGGGIAGSGGTTGGGGSGGTGATGATGGNGGAGGSGGTQAGAIGSPCATDDSCNSGLFCESPAVFGASSSAQICSRGCCSSEDCGAGSEICYPAVHGGSACVPSSSVGRGAVGTVPTGGACTNHSDCRSGLCDKNKCFDTCCADSDCPGTDMCVKTTLPGTTRSVMACGPSAGAGGFLSFCTNGCKSNICSSGTYCSKPCCNVKDCTGAVNLFCTQVDGLKRCAYSPGLGTKLLGATCNGAGECATGYCVSMDSSNYFCSDTCCSDFDCGTGFGCRPVSLSSKNYLLCVKL